MKHYTFLFFYSIFLLPYVLLNSQTKIWTQYNCATYGFPCAPITSIITDKDDIVWFGTTSGLVRYDGVTFAVFNTTNSGLPVNYITSLVEDQFGNKWIGTYTGGLVKYNGNTWIVYNTANSGIPDNKIICMYFDDSGVLWLGCANFLVKHYNDIWETKWSASGVWIRSIAIDRFDRKWIGTGNGLYKYNDTTITAYYSHTSGLPSNNITSVVIDCYGKKWIGTYSGIIVYDDVTWSTYGYSSTMYPNVYYIGFDETGLPWVSTDWGLLKYNNNNSWQVFAPMGTSCYTSFCYDSKGTMWFGYQYGIIKYGYDVKPTWTYLNNTNSAYPSTTANDMTIDSQGNKWIISWGNLIKIMRNKWIIYNTTNSGMPTGNGNLQRVAVDKNGVIWLVRGNKELISFDGKRWNVYTTPITPPINMGPAFLIDNNDNKWLSLFDQGVYKFKDSTWTLYTTTNNVTPIKYIADIDEDSSGVLWFCGASNIFSFDGQIWKTIPSGIPGGDLPKNGYALIIENKNKRHWVTGLSSINSKVIVTYNDTSLTYLRISSGVNLNEWVYDFKYENTNTKWIVTNDKITKVIGSTFLVLDSLNSGLPNSSLNRLVIDRSGDKWILTSFEGIAILHEDEIIPMELSSFSVTVEENKVCVNWITATETNVSHFEIERKINEDNAEWLNVTAIKAKGTSTVPRVYSYYDKNLSQAEYCYRLKTVDLDGSFSYSSVVNVHIGMPSEYKLFQNHPNPFNPATIIKYSIPNFRSSGNGGGIVSLKIYDILGKEVATLVNEEKLPGMYEVEFNASHFSSGVYFYQLKAGDYINTKMMILQK